MPMKLSEIKVSTIFFFNEDGEGSFPMYLGTFKYDGKVHPTTVVKELFSKHPKLHKVFDDWDDDDECIFQVVRDTFGTAHYTQPICHEESNVSITAGELRGHEEESEEEYESEEELPKPKVSKPKREAPAPPTDDVKVLCAQVAKLTATVEKMQKEMI